MAVRPVDGISLGYVTLLVDGHPLATLNSPPYHVLWRMTAGTHVFTALGMDANGNELEGNKVMIVVVE